MAMINVIKIVGLFVRLLASTIGYLDASAQEIPGYKVFSSDRLGMSFEYPSSWTIEEKENRFDSGLEVMVQDGLNVFSVLSRDDTIKEGVESLGFETVVNMLKNKLVSQGTLIEDSNFDRYEIDGREIGTFPNDDPKRHT